MSVGCDGDNWSCVGVGDSFEDGGICAGGVFVVSAVRVDGFKRYLELAMEVLDLLREALTSFSPLSCRFPTDYSTGTHAPPFSRIRNI